ncbi:MAG: TnsD family Tn7-like transposition protein [Pseudomonadota bacterium]
MLAYFPEILPDELLYSALARLRRHRGLGAASVLMEELFGRSHAVASFDLPGGIGALAERLDAGTGLDADWIIRRTTLFPFLTAFVSGEIRQTTRRAMVESTVGAHMRLGLAASRIPPIGALRYCPACLGPMVDGHGERYWRRSHQLPGVTVCPDHGVALLRSPVVFGRTRRHGFVAADDIDLAASVEMSVPADAVVAERLRGLAMAATDLLDRPPAAGTPAETSEAYRSRLADVGLATGAKVDQAGLEEAFMRHWGAALDYVPGVLAGGRLRGGWLASLVRPRPRAMHPICHLLLRTFLDGLAVIEPPFGRGPWECCNPVSPHLGEPVVFSLHVRRDRETLYGDFECECGYVYTRRRSADGSFGPPRYRSFGPDFVPALTQAIARGEGLRAVARRLGLDPKTLMREAAIANVATPWRLAPSGTVDRRGAPRLRRAVQSPRLTTRHGGRARDWSFTDRRLAKAVRAEAVVVLSSLPPVRVTFSELERRVGSPCWIRDRRAKLPITAECIASLIETTDAFRGRRLEWVLSECDGLAEVTASDVLRRAGLPGSWMPKVRAAIAAGCGHIHVAEAA